MLSNDTIQAGLVTRLKTIEDIASLVSGTYTGAEIREMEWSGVEFSYPNIRVDLTGQTPSIEGCAYGEIDIFFRVHTEDASSQNCDAIAGAIFKNFPRSFTNNGVYFSGMVCTRLGGAFRTSQRVWQANVQYQAFVSG